MDTGSRGGTHWRQFVNFARSAVSVWARDDLSLSLNLQWCCTKGKCPPRTRALLPQQPRRKEVHHLFLAASVPYRVGSSHPSDTVLPCIAVARRWPWAPNTRLGERSVISNRWTALKWTCSRSQKSGRSQGSQAVRRRGSSEPRPLQVHLEPWVPDVQFRQRDLPILHMHGWEVFFHSSSSSQVAVVWPSVFVD